MRPLSWKTAGVGFMILVFFLSLTRFTNPNSWDSLHDSVKSWSAEKWDKWDKWAHDTSSSKQSSSPKEANSTLLELAKPYVKAIMNPEDNTFSRLECQPASGSRYQYLSSDAPPSDGKRTYFFAIDLHDSAKVLPRLLGSVVEAIRFLGPEHCVLSIVEGRSIDGTFEILKLLQADVEGLGAKFLLDTSEAAPRSGDRVKLLAELRNQVLQPLVGKTDEYAADATVIFLNDVAICLEDILELVHQRQYQNADMTCAMDWTYVGPDPTFYDIWIARGMNGDSFFEIPPDGNWNSAWNLFWNNDKTAARYNMHKPFQVFSCWNGATAFTAKPILEDKVRFRSPSKKECHQGEPQLFCKDMWHQGYGKIAVVPAINLEYSDEKARKIKELKGYVSKWVGKDGDNNDDTSLKIDWETSPPPRIKCMADYANQSWEPWNEGLV